MIYSLAPSSRDVDLIWAGTDDGLVHVTHDAGKTWENVTPSELTPWSKIAQMDASHFDTDTVYAAVNRFRLDDLHPYIYRTHDGGKSWTKIVNGIPDDEPVNTVREDPQRKGLLFAGTERTVYVSFDDGDHWQSLRLNLPATSIRDLVIHGDDVVVGTHGRSFWILDNITPLRQIDLAIVGSDVRLFTPQITYRVRRDNNTDTPLPPEEPAGKNPPDGAMLDYFLKSEAKEVDIEIVDSSGKAIRKFSSADKSEQINESKLNIPTYWIRPQQIPSTAPGMHRFVWDLRYPAPQSVRHEYPISAIYRDTPRLPLGPAALPGRYTVKLTVNGKNYTQPLMIKTDPRVKASEDDLRRQFELETGIVSIMSESYGALQQVRTLREQLKAAKARAKQARLIRDIGALEQRAAELQGSEGGWGALFLSTPEGRSLTRLNVGLNTLLSAVDSADAAPTSGESGTFHDVEAALKQQLTVWNEIKSKDVPALNLQLRKTGLPLVNIASAAATIQQHWRFGAKGVD